MSAFTEEEEFTESEQSKFPEEKSKLEQMFRKAHLYSKEVQITLKALSEELDVFQTAQELEETDMVYFFNEEISNLSPLESFANLEVLDISDTRVVDLTPIARLINLKKISMANTKIKDLTVLEGLHNLEYVDVSGSAVSKQSIAVLKAKFPKLAIRTVTKIGM